MSFIYLLFLSFITWPWVYIMFGTRFIPAVLEYLTGAKCFFRVGGKMISLTIDDSPDPRTTPLILDMLRKYNVRVTFFIIGERAKQYPELMKSIVNDGHLLANHDYHDRASLFAYIKSHEDFMSDVNKTQIELLKITNTSRSNWFRPGVGLSFPGFTKYLGGQGYTSILGDVYPLDAHFPFSSLSIPWILCCIRPGSVVIMHDGTLKRAENTIATLDYVIPKLKKQGYFFYTLDQMRSDEELNLK
jgi:peptidoglycan/xylan/chitin deacetylase (PgdA/CDA1 family)